MGGSLGFTTGRWEGLDCCYVADIAHIIIMVFYDFILGLVTISDFL